MILTLKMLHFNGNLGEKVKTGKGCYEAMSLVLCELSVTCGFCSEYLPLSQHLIDDVAT